MDDSVVGVGKKKGVAMKIHSIFRTPQIDGLQDEDERTMECNCSLRIKLVGDGCELCNPALAAQIAADNDEDEDEDEDEDDNLGARA